jgi:hypothetical protein
MKSNFTLETILAGGTILALLLLANPGDWFMSDMVSMTIVCVAAILFLGFISFVFAESPHDEREELHRYIAARLGYLGGTGMLMFLIVWEKLFMQMIDTKLIMVLGAMLLMKVAGGIYAKYKF